MLPPRSPPEGGGRHRGPAVAPLLPSGPLSANSLDSPLPKDPFRISLNTSTLQGQKLTMDRLVDVTAEAGYAGDRALDPDLDRHLEGRALRDLGRGSRIVGSRVEGAIGFFEWAVDDDGRRRKALDEARRNMEIVRQIAGVQRTTCAAAPVGEPARVGPPPRRRRYRHCSIWAT